MLYLIGLLALLFLLTLLLLPAVLRGQSRSIIAGSRKDAGDHSGDHGADARRDQDPDFARLAREFRASGRLVLPPINFRPNEARIDRPSPALRRHLELVREYFLERNPSGSGLNAGARQSEDHEKAAILISGHTDRQGSREHNLALSLARAQAVADLLRDEYGLPENALRAVGRGFSDPVADNASSTGRQRNRRVEIQLEAD